MDRHWLLTSTTYGTWLPGDRRCFVGGTRDMNGSRVLNNVSDTPYHKPIPPLYDFARTAMKGRGGVSDQGARVSASDSVSRDGGISPMAAARRCYHGKSLPPGGQCSSR